MLLFLELNEQLGWLIVSSEAESLAGMVYLDPGLYLHAQLGAKVPHVGLNSIMC